MDCLICYETYELSALAKCPRCNFDCCVKCWKTWHMRDDNFTVDPMCMGCKETWNDDELYKCFKNDKNWIDGPYLEYRKRLFQIEFDTNIPMFTSRLKAKRTLEKFEQEYDKCNNWVQSRELQYSRNTLNKKQSKKFPAKLQRRNDLYSHMKFIRQFMRDPSMSEETLCNLINIYYKPQTFNGFCPNSKCTGKLNNVGLIYQCAICFTEVCKRCTDIKLDGHVCNPANVLSAAFVKSDAKLCPACRSPIHKYLGCNDMRCAQCKTSFNWVTLKIYQTQPSGIRNHLETDNMKDIFQFVKIKFNSITTTVANVMYSDCQYRGSRYIESAMVGQNLEYNVKNLLQSSTATDKQRFFIKSLFTGLVYILRRTHEYIEDMNVDRFALEHGIEMYCKTALSANLDDLWELKKSVSERRQRIISAENWESDMRSYFQKICKDKIMISYSKCFRPTVRSITMRHNFRVPSKYCWDEQHVKKEFCIVVTDEKI